MAEILANYFTTVATNIGGAHVCYLTEDDLENHSSIGAIRDSYSGPEFTFGCFSTGEIHKAIEKTEPRKSCGWDHGASPKLLKTVADGIAQSLTVLYNNCIKLDQWPTAWKMGEWTPALKKGDNDRLEEKSYRPITSLICIDKIFEQLLSRQVMSHYDHSLYRRTTAYRKQHSCETTLLTLVEEWRQAIDKKELTTVLSMDMSKAFDSLCHALTIKKLDAYGFGNGAPKMMRSFFDGRLNRVKINGCASAWKPMERGCPLGSAFGTLLWNMFQNDLAYHFKGPSLTMYANNHQLYVTGKSYDTVETQLKQQGEFAKAWYKDNFLLANPDKYQLLTINPRNLDATNSGKVLNIDDQEIKKTKEIKLLGVIIDEHLNFTNHISDVYTKVSQKIGVLTQLV